MSQRLCHPFIRRQTGALDTVGIGFGERLENVLGLMLRGKLQSKHQGRRPEANEQQKGKGDSDRQP